LAAFISEGHLARHVRKMRKLYGERREILQGALERFCGNHIRVVGIGAGLHLAAYLSDSISAPALVDKAREAGIALNTIERFATSGREANGLVFGYGAIGSHQIVDAVRQLAKLMK
jgi:GntR family transcriptional regulator / MocR family aminotransferase